MFLVSILRGHKGVRLVGVPPPSKASSKLHTKAVCEHRHDEFVHQQEPAVSLWPFAAQAAVDGLSAYVFEGRVPAHILQRAAKQRAYKQRVAARRHALRYTGVCSLTPMTSTVARTMTWGDGHEWLKYFAGANVMQCALMLPGGY